MAVNDDIFEFKDYVIGTNRFYHTPCKSVCKWQDIEPTKPGRYKYISFRCYKCKEKIPDDVRAFWILVFNPINPLSFEGDELEK